MNAVLRVLRYSLAIYWFAIIAFLVWCRYPVGVVLALVVGAFFQWAERRFDVRESQGTRP